MTPPIPARPTLPWTPAEVDVWANTLLALLPKWQPDRRHPYCADDADLINAIAWGCYMAATAPARATHSGDRASEQDQPASQCVAPTGFDHVRSLCEILFASGVETGRTWPTVDFVA